MKRLFHSSVLSVFFLLSVMLHSDKSIAGGPSTLWSYDVGVPHSRLVLPDINADGYDELLLYEDYEQIRVISGIDGLTQLWSYQLSIDPGRFRRGLSVINDLDGDGINDIIAVAGTSGNDYGQNNGDDDVFAISGAITPPNNRLLWFGGESLNIGYGANGPITLSDTNGDTFDDIFVTTITPESGPGPLRGDYGYLISGGDGAIMWNWTYNPVSFPQTSESRIWDIYGRAVVPDLDGDRIDDIIVSGAGGYSGIEAWKGGGGAAVNIWRSLDFIWIRSPAAIADITGDGVPEIAAAKFNTEPLMLYVLDGANGSEVWSFSFGNTATDIQDLGDVNASGFSDVVTGSAYINGVGGTDYKVYVLEGDPDASNRIVWSYDLVDEGHYVRVIEDINFDGIKDLIVSTTPSGRLLYLDGSNGSLLAEDNFFGGVGPAQAGEFNTSPGEEFLINVGNEVFAIPRATPGSGPQGASFPTQSIISTNALTAFSVYAADIDNDGDLDVLSASDDDDTVAWYENTDGAGSFSAANIISNIALGARAVFSADIDGDQDMDVIAANWDDGKISWYRNGPTLGQFTEIPVATHINPVGIFAADLDGDQDLDILSASYGDHTTAWYENLDGLGTSWTEHTVTTETSGAWDVYAADLDNDGDLDVVSAANWGNYDNNSNNENGVAWYENRLNEVSNDFGPQQVISAAADGARVVRVADINGDGDLDVISASWFDGKVAWYENMGGSFGDPTQNQNMIATANINTQAMHVADLDNDGDVDVLYGSWQDGGEHKIIWMENADGFGTVWNSRDISSEIIGCQSIYVVDLDGDRDLDVLSASQDDNKIAWYPNQGGSPDIDSDGDGIPDSQDGCPFDPDKIDPGQCGCGETDADSDADGVADCVDFYPDNTENKPILDSPLNDNSIPAGNDISFISSGFQPINDVTHEQTHWRVWRSDSGELIYDQIASTGLNKIILPFDLFMEGLQYEWQVGYEDSTARIVYSAIGTFKVGTPEEETLPEIGKGTDVGDFGMVSIVHWPNDPRPQAVFDIDYDPRSYRIGTYDALSSSYIEFDYGLQMKPGKSYWILAREGLTVNFNGVPVSTSTAVYVALDYNSNTSDGWNMVAPPNEADYYWGDVMVVEYTDGVLIDRDTIENLADDNAYIDRRLWRWENGGYASDTPDTDPVLEMKAYAGYWVKAKQPNVYLRFDPGIPLATRSMMEIYMAKAWHQAKTLLSKINLFSKEAVAIDDDSPPLPPAALDNNDIDPVFGGCFVGSSYKP